MLEWGKVILCEAAGAASGLCVTYVARQSQPSVTHISHTCQSHLSVTHATSPCSHLLSVPGRVAVQACGGGLHLPGKLSELS